MESMCPAPTLSPPSSLLPRRGPGQKEGAAWEPTQRMQQLGKLGSGLAGVPRLNVMVMPVGKFWHGSFFSSEET